MYAHSPSHSLSATAYPRCLVVAQHALRHARAAAAPEVHRAAVLRTQKAFMPYSTATPLSHTRSAAAVPALFLVGLAILNIALVIVA